MLIRLEITISQIQGNSLVHLFPKADLQKNVWHGNQWNDYFSDNITSASTLKDMYI